MIDARIATRTLVPPLILALLATVASAADGGGLTATVVKKDLPIQVELSGVFTAEDKDEIRIEPKEYRGDLIVTKLLDEGTEVVKGDVLMEFEQDSLTRALDDARNEVTDAEVELGKSRADQEAFEIDQNTTRARLEKELSMAELACQAAVEKAEFELASKQQGIADTENRLRDGKVDYEQLIQLYEERELHTATENILIEREKRNVENLDRSLSIAKRDFEHWKRFEKEKEILEKEIEVDKKKAELKQHQVKFAANLAEKKAAVAKAERKLDKATKKVSDLEADGKTLSVTSPRDGVVFFGRTDDDSPTDVVIFGDRNNEMRVGGRVRTHDILMTIAAMDNLSIKMRVLENDIQHMRAGLPISVVPDAFPYLELHGKLDQVDQIASREGFFSEVREFTVKGSYEGVFPQLRSGMNCRVTVRADNVPAAIQVPVVAVFEDAGQYFCFVEVGTDAQKRRVTLGETNGKSVAVTEGLKEGETVFLYDPHRE